MSEKNNGGQVAKDLADARVERVLAKHRKSHADEHKDKALQHLANAREATARQDRAAEYWQNKIAADPGASKTGEAETQRADARRGVAVKV